MNSRSRGAALAACLAFLGGPAAAIGFGQSDTFEDGSTQGWDSGAANGSPPVNVAGGGPAGAADHYMLVTGSGVHGPGGKLVALGGVQWTGNYLAAGVSGITMDVDNFGSTDLSLRLYVLGGVGLSALSLTPVTLAAGSGWTQVFFDLSPATLLGPAEATLANVTGLRLYHGPTAAYPGVDVAAALGVDNITAVPEPGPAALLAAGLAVLGLQAWRRRRRAA